MAVIHNSDLTKALIDGAKLQTSSDRVPAELAEKVVPVMEVNPKLLRRAEVCSVGAATNATSGTVYTIPADKEFYCTASSMSVIKDASSTSVFSSMIATGMDGQTITLLTIPSITLTAQSESEALSFVPPLKIKPGTTIALTNSTNVANINTRGTITGYLVDNSRA